MAQPTLVDVVNSGVIPPGLHDLVVGNAFKYTAAGDHVIELITILITLTQHISDLKARVVALETFANITPDPSTVF